MQPPTPSQPKHAGFSLIEIVLALGIISFALVGILGLFPVAVDAASDSQRETQAALIARSIFDQLEATPGVAKRSIHVSQTLDSETPAPKEVDLSQSKSTMIGYDTDGHPTTGADDPATVFKVEVAVSPITTPQRNLSTVLVTVSPVAARTSGYTFASILRQK